MSITSKVAVAVDIMDWNRIDRLVQNIDAAHETYDVHTPDNTYRCVYWDDVNWCRAASCALTKVLNTFRHSIVEITEDGRIISDIVESDDRGTDEEFSELLSWTADICFWHSGEPLTPVRQHGTWHTSYVPMSRERAIQLLTAYVENDAQAAETGYIYEALTLAGASHKEIKALGFEFCIPEDDTCCICGGEIKGYGNDPWPVVTTNGAKCCDRCNSEVVLPARIIEMEAREKEA